MSYRTKLLGLGLEDDQSLAGGEEQTVDTGAQELLEVNEVAAEIDQTHEAVAEAQESSDQLEEVAAALESMIEAGRGLSADAARFAHQSVSFATRKFGIATPMPAMESFSTGASGQFGQTKASLEGIKETIQKIWTWIKAQFAKLRGHMKDFWLKTFDGAIRLKKRAEAMMKKAEAVSGSAKETQVTVSADLVGKLHVGGKLGDIAAELAKFKTVTDALLGKVTEEMVKGAEECSTAIKGISFDSVDKLNDGIGKYLAGRTAVSTAAKSIANIDASGEGPHKHHKANNVAVTRTDELIGGSAIYFFSNDNYKLGQNADEVILEALKSDAISSGKVLGVAEKAPETKETKVTTLSGGAVSKICEEVMGIAGSVESFRRNYASQEKAKDAFTAAGKHVESEAAKAEKLDASGQKLASAFVRAINSVPTMIDQPAQKLAQHTVSTLNAVLNFAQLHLNQYGK